MWMIWSPALMPATSAMEPLVTSVTTILVTSRLRKDPSPVHLHRETEFLVGGPAGLGEDEQQEEGYCGSSEHK